MRPADVPRTEPRAPLRTLVDHKHSSKSRANSTAAPEPGHGNHGPASWWTTLPAGSARTGSRQSWTAEIAGPVLPGEPENADPDHPSHARNRRVRHGGEGADAGNEAASDLRHRCLQEGATTPGPKAQQEERQGKPPGVRQDGGAAANTFRAAMPGPGREGAERQSTATGTIHADSAPRRRTPPCSGATPAARSGTCNP